MFFESFRVPTRCDSGIDGALARHREWPRRHEADKERDAALIEIKWIVLFPKVRRTDGGSKRSFWRVASIVRDDKTREKGETGGGKGHCEHARVWDAPASSR